MAAAPTAEAIAAYEQLQALAEDVCAREQALAVWLVGRDDDLLCSAGDIAWVRGTHSEDIRRLSTWARTQSTAFGSAGGHRIMAQAITGGGVCLCAFDRPVENDHLRAVLFSVARAMSQILAASTTPRGPAS
jgi:hypothetical protein